MRRSAARGAVRLELDEALAVPQQLPGVDLLALNDALDRLAEMDERQSRIVELRFFAGLSIQETADLMELSLLQLTANGLRRRLGSSAKYRTAGRNG